ncbi:MAG: recombinase family protein [Actinomycetota bacterium]|nr:recombinase family protein [Actinomycetota bacterium]
MKVVGYLRVSTDRQAERGLGLDVQKAAIQSWAKKNGHKVVRWCRDEGVSGSNGVENRVGLLDALSALREKKAGGVVVARLDRVARDLIVQETLLAEIKRLGAQPFSTSDGEAGYLADDSDDPSRKLIRQVLGAVAEYDRAMISLRLRVARRHKSANGGYAHGAPPFGYRAENGALVTDEREQKIIRRMRELEAAGRTQPEIAKRLNAEGLRTKRGSEWTRLHVGKILRRSEEVV